MPETRDIRLSPDALPRAQIRISSRNDWRVGVELHGDFDVAVAGALARTLGEELDAGRHLLHLDLTYVTFLDCAVLGVLASIDKRCRSQHASLILVDVPPAVVRLIALCELDQVLLVSVGAGTAPFSGEERGYPTAPAVLGLAADASAAATVLVPARTVTPPVTGTSDIDDEPAGVGVA